MDRTEVWERRPGGRWEVVHCGSLGATTRFIERCVLRRKGARFAAPVEQVIVRVGEYPTRETTPTALVQ